MRRRRSHHSAGPLAGDQDHATSDPVNVGEKGEAGGWQFL